MKKYTNRKFLNKKNNGMSETIHCYAGEEFYDKKKHKMYFLRLASCHSITTIHAGNKKEMIKKLKIIRHSINDFIKNI